MSSHTAPPADPTAAPRGRLRWTLAVFTASVFLSAFLLFLVEPMFSRMVLPLLGGTPAVWNTCMLFFQAALLAGYLYAHAGARRWDARRQAWVHLGVLALAVIFLPIVVRAAGPEGGTPPIPWLLALMATTVGVPFFVLAGTGPMLQRWFAGTGHPDAHNPYFLYAASNLGSMLALVSYPLLVEPRLGLAQQSRGWTAGYVALALLVAGCAVALGRSAPAAERTASAGEDRAGTAEGVDGGVTLRERARWVLLAFVPSSLFLSITTLITTDITPAPLFWVIPLALYLVSFTLTFARRPPISHGRMLRLQPVLVIAVAILVFLGFSDNAMVLIPVHLLAFFVTAMVCHGELARSRPAVRHLTEFYLWVSVGGTLGGIFNVLLAPVLFPRILEYPIGLALGCLLRPAPQVERSRDSRVLDWVLPLGFAGALFAITRSDFYHAPVVDYRFMVVAAFVSLVCVLLSPWPVRLGLGVGAALLLGTLNEHYLAKVLLTRRTFFGIYTVRMTTENGGYHSLTHGTTLHGAQSLARPREPLTYYNRGGPLGNLFASLPPKPGRRVAVVGLGTGTIAAYGRPGERWTYYEIDPAVVRIARDRRYFTYLSDSPADIRVVLGDARLSLARAPEHEYDLIVLDAFSSDAIPVHLMTREALRTYLSRLAPGGVIAFHLSNRFLDLKPVVGALVRDAGIAARFGQGLKSTSRYGSASDWAVVARREEDLGSLLRDSRWRPLPVRPEMAPWTDDFSNLWSVMRW